MQTTLVNTHLTAAQTFLRHEKPKTALIHCRRAAALDPTNVPSREILCEIYSGQGDLESTLQIRGELAKISPNDPRQWLQLGILRYQAQQFAKAEEAFRRLIQLAPEQPQGYLMLAQILMRPGHDHSEAVSMARKGIEMAPTAPNYHVLGAVYENTGNKEAARKALAKAIQLEPENPKYREAYRRLQ
jgi:cytochrome c-type biogenesis protein CcmH/NrfG